ncbi:YjbF family lipoprotein [Roseovarius sp. M141]|uniref:YjbF family lipoprotein n=1 Tax=Roseovarius sp. M141 TaxID=2583806 RepID=UPI0020CB7F80|nr:YjbF family lipoprotein [Roseovarius sp. M141]MCQ0091847.1 YjbF family lipoprotein [Roseovarius sp. M141]
MSVMNAVRGVALGLACLTMIAGCSNAPDDQVTAGTFTKSILKGRKATPAPSAQRIAADVAKALAATDAPLILLVIPERQAVTVMQKLEQNRGYDTYGTADRRTVTLRGGMVSATRGLGNDIMSSDIEAVRALVSTRQAGTAQRVTRYLDGEDLTIAEVRACTVRITETNARITHVSETCKGDGTDFTNTYQVTADGLITQSRQWHSPSAQYLTIQKLR